MDKRYQVFVSSTFTDLKAERSKVIQTLMEMDCIPAGMELFPAIDEEQFNFIKSVIDDSDYYIVIIGGRYGSISEDGLSYTEMEYDYAIEKGLNVLAFLHSDPGKILSENTEQEPALKQKLELFKQKLRNGRLVKFWKSAEELPGLVSLSLQKTIKTYPATGWVRGDVVASSELYKEIAELQKEIALLKKSSQPATNDVLIGDFPFRKIKDQLIKLKPFDDSDCNALELFKYYQNLFIKGIGKSNETYKVVIELLCPSLYILGLIETRGMGFFITENGTRFLALELLEGE